MSEGRIEQKRSAIYRSNYLATVYDDVLAVYGWSFRDEDDHIVEALSRGRLKRIAVSIHTNSQDWRTTRKRARAKVKEYFPARRRPALIFFDSASVPFAEGQ